jgi:hypothetical protein
VHVKFKNTQQLGCEIDKNTGAFKCFEAPRINVTKINFKGQFTVKFSEPVNITELSDSNITH